MRHRPSRWRWGIDEDLGDAGDFALYVHCDKQVWLHPKLRLTKNHDTLWTSLGHELVHQIYRDNGSTATNEARAYRLEKHAGEVLHDFYHRFKDSGLPRCTGAKCRVKPKK